MKPTLPQSTAYQDRQHHLHIPRLHPFAGCPAAAAGAASISSQASGLSLDLVATPAPLASSFRRFEGGDLSTAAPSLEVHSKSRLSATPLRNRAKTDVTGPHATTMNGFHGQQSPPNGAANLTVHAHGLMDGTAASTMSAGHKASGPMPVSGKTSSATGEMSPRALSGAMPRSPPKNKNTAHVPCKFWLAGSCTAGRMCPFSHDLESSTRPAPCKYFAKGGCKFGRKCALLHVAPDGTVVNRVPPPSYSQHPRGYTTSSHGLMTGGGYGPASPGLLSMQAQALDIREGTDGSVDYDLHQNIARNGTEQIHIDYTSASPSFGSPQDHRFGASPSQRGLSVLDAPLPSSFDSNGISLAARNGPFAASVPSRFGLESPPASLPRKSHLGSTALRDLHNSAFGDLGMDGMLASMGSSPPSGTDEPLTFPKRSLHSDRLRASRPIFSASLGTRLPMESLDYSDEDGDTDREEDLLPASLRDLIPEGRSRRESRSRNDEDSPAAHLAAQRRTISISGHGTPADSKVGSPHSSSPSRYTGMFAARAQANKSEVGSPLRNAGFSYAQAISSSSSAQSKPLGSGELSPSISSPPRQASMSMLTQELQRTKLDAARAAAAGTSHPLPVTTRSFSNGSASSNPKRRSLERGMSSTSVGKIDEEQELFDMDEVGDRPTATSKAIPRSTPSDINSLSTSPWNARPFGVSMSSSPNHRKVDPSELLTFGAIGSHRK